VKAPGLVPAWQENMKNLIVLSYNILCFALILSGLGIKLYDDWREKKKGKNP